MKLRNRALIKILTALILLAVTLSIPLMAYAGSEDGLAEEQEIDIGTKSGGASWLKAGYLIYMVTADNPDAEPEVMSPVTFLYYSGYDPRSISTYATAVYSRFEGWGGGGNIQPSAYMDISSYALPRPFDSDGNGNGVKLKEKMLGEEYVNGKKTVLATQILYEGVKNSSGAAAAQTVVDEFMSTDNNVFRYIIIEAVYWIQPMNNMTGRLEGKTVMATAYGWADILDDFGYTSTGHYYGRYTNRNYIICMSFDQDWFGLGTIDLGAGERGSTDYIRSHSGGMIAIYNRSLIDSQTTNDESQSVKHSPPEESTGNYQIVKNYVDKNTDANGVITYTDAGTYTKLDSSNLISIEDETSNTGYTLVEWRATDSSDTSVESVSSDNSQITWQSNVPYTNEPVGGTTEYTIDLEDSTTDLGETGKTAAELGLKTVYLLLLKSGEEEVEKEDGVNFTISESAVTRRVSFSEDENATVSTEGPIKLKTYVFTWTRAEFPSQCSGHTYYCFSGSSRSHGSCNNYDTTDHKKDVEHTNDDGTTYTTKEHDYYTYTCKGHKVYCQYTKWVDKSATFKIKNDKFPTSSNEALAVASSGTWQVFGGSEKSLTPWEWTVSESGSGTGAEPENGITTAAESRNAKEGKDYTVVLWRGNKDKLTVAEWKNTSTTNDLMSSIGFNVANTPIVNGRKTQSYSETFDVKFVYDTSGIGGNSVSRGTDGVYGTGDYASHLWKCSDGIHFQKCFTV